MRLVSEWFSTKRKAVMMGLVVTIGFCGGIVAQSPFTWLMHMTHGWRNAMLVNAAFGLLIGLLIFIFVKNPPGNVQNNGISIQRNVLKSLRSSITKQNWLCGIYTGLIGTPTSVLGDLWGNLYLTQVKRYSALVAGSLSSLIFFGLVVGSTVNGWLSDSLGRRKPPLFIGALGVIISSLIVIYLPVPTYILAFLLFMLGIFCGFQVVCYPLVVESNPMEIESTSIAFISIVINIIGASSQILLGWLIDLQWNGERVNGIPIYSAETFKHSLLLLPIEFLLCFIIVFFIRETFNKRVL